MANAKLHLICGNCGCNDMWKWRYEPEALDNGDGTFTPDVFLTCDNCATLHGLSDNAQMKPSNTHHD